MSASAGISASVFAPVFFFVLGDLLLEGVGLGVEHDLGEHLDEAAVGVVGEALVAALGDQPLDRLVVQAEVEDGVHHAGHGKLGAGAHRDEQRILGVAELLAGLLLDDAQRGHHLVPQPVGEALAVVVILVAGLGSDSEAGWDGQPGVGHLGDASALAAEQVAHRRVALAEEIDPLVWGTLDGFLEGERGGFGHESLAPCSGIMAGATLGHTMIIVSIMTCAANTRRKCAYLHTRVPSALDETLTMLARMRSAIASKMSTNIIKPAKVSSVTGSAGSIIY